MDFVGLGWIAPTHGNPQFQTGESWMKSSPEEEEDLRILVDERLDTSWQCETAAQKNNQILGFFKRRVASRVRGR